MLGAMVLDYYYNCVLLLFLMIMIITLNTQIPLFYIFFIICGFLIVVCLI